MVDLKKNRLDHEVVSPKKIVEQPYRVQLKRIQNHLQADVRIQTNTRGAGQITIKFKNEKEFERLQNLLG